jgi:hypothetical protein
VLLALKPMFDALCLVRGVVVTSCLLYDLGVGFSVSEFLRHFQCSVSYMPAIAVTMCYTYDIRLQCVSVFLLAAYTICIGLLVLLVHYRHHNSPMD